jgi:outer membrane protein assembly factor BamB
MQAQRTLIFSLALLLLTASASASPVVYVVTFNGQFGSPTAGEFGTINLANGAYTQIGPSLSDPLGGLVPGGPTGLLGVSFDGNFESINPATGAVSVIGATGLGALALDTAELNGRIYETDFNNNLYAINPTTGLATLIGATGIPPTPGTDPADLIDEALFAAGGNLYATFDAFNVTTLALVDSPELYQINPTNGMATLVAPTTFQINAATGVNGTIYAFTGTQVLSLNVANGNTSFVTDYNPAAFFPDGATVVTPEPISFGLAGIGIAAILVSKRRWRQS